MRTFISLFVLLLLAGTAVKSQPAKWELKIGTEVIGPELSPDGTRMLYFTDTDSLLLHCIDVATGKQLWRRILTGVVPVHINRFIGNDTVFLAEGVHLEFLDAEDGSLLKPIRIIGEDLDDMTWKTTSDDGFDPVQGHFEGNLGIFFYEDGIQFLDMKNAERVYQGTESFGKIKYSRWDSTLLLNPYAGGDTFYIFDTRTAKLLYKGSKEDSELNPSVYQPYIVSGNTLLLMNEDNIESIDLATGKRNALIEVDPDDPEYYTPLIFKKGLYLLVSDEGIQKMYDVKSGTLLWQTKQGEVPGIVEQATELESDEALLVCYEMRGNATAYKINTKTGSKIWGRPLFAQDGELDPGHKQASKLSATLKAIGVDLLMGPPSGRWETQRVGGIELTTYHSNYYERQKFLRNLNEMYSSWVNVKKSTDGYASLLRQTDAQVTFVNSGRIYKPGAAANTREYDGESITTLNLPDGSIVSNSPFKMLALSESRTFNAYKDANILSLDSAKVLIGVHDVYIAHGDLVEHLPFGEQTITVINHAANEVTIQVSGGAWIDYLRLNVASPTTKRYLLARSTTRNIVFHDSASISTSIRYNDGLLEAFPLIEGDVDDARFSAPKWKLTEEEIDKLGIGDIDVNVSTSSHLSGIALYGGDVMLLGDEGIGYVSSDGGCRWSYPWRPSWKYARLGLTKFGNGFVYSVDDETAVMSAGCPAHTVTKYAIDYSDSRVFLAKKGTSMVIMDVDEGILYGYQME